MSHNSVFIKRLQCNANISQSSHFWFTFLITVVRINNIDQSIQDRFHDFMICNQNMSKINKWPFVYFSSLECPNLKSDLNPNPKQKNVKTSSKKHPLRYVILLKSMYPILWRSPFTTDTTNNTGKVQECPCL